MRFHRWCTIHPRMITLETIIHHGTVLKIFIMIIYELWNLDLVPPYMLPQQINSTHVPHLSIHPKSPHPNISLSLTRFKYFFFYLPIPLKSIIITLPIDHDVRRSNLKSNELENKFISSILMVTL